MESKKGQKGTKVGDEIIVTEVITPASLCGFKIGEVGIVTKKHHNMFWLGSDENEGKYSWVKGVIATPLNRELL